MTNLEKLLLKHEGLRLKPYKDSVGKWTIGIGRNLDDNGISEEEAILMLRNDINGCLRDLAPHDWFKDLDIIRQDVLLNMCFNLGINRLLNFKRMIECLKKHDYMGAANEALDSKWAKQVGRRADELAEMLRTGEYR